MRTKSCDSQRNQPRVLPPLHALAEPSCSHRTLPSAPGLLAPNTYAFPVFAISSKKKLAAHSQKRDEPVAKLLVTSPGIPLGQLPQVIDVYQAWCGPCKAMQPLFRKLKNEINEEEILHFVVNGKIIAKIQGANAPLVNKKIIALVNEEKKIAAGEMVRPEYPDILLMELEKARKKIERENHSIVIIKPDAVLKRKAQEIKEKITTAGFVIEAEEKTMLTKKQVRDFYSQMEDQPDFEEFLSFMTTSLSHVLIIAQGKEWDQLEENETEFKETSELPTESDVKKWDSLQEYLEQQRISQFCDVEDDAAIVTKFTDVFFPDFKITKGKKLQKTLALLRPDLLEKQNEVLNIIKGEGFEILMERQIVLSEEEAKMLCKEYENESYFEALIEKMTRALCWGASWPPPFSQEESSLLRMSAVCAEIMKLIKEEGFELTQMKDMLLTPGQVEKIYFQITKKDFYKDVVEVLSELEKIDGSSRPRRSETPDPDSIRARFGISILKNAVHGSTNHYTVRVNINELFEEDAGEQ
ncbi:Thioredoxin domain-containing protein 3 [Fukomys damarensis]|uniref:Thioredoxin domain-containing protein 3 n=1 Tax=Fukomys damarensis TaxID=885580 RepID=A0A091D5M9_FUKDA|nr:Thioredoxin domain-containing protein 3 [Fukomys damarensis]